MLFNTRIKVICIFFVSFVEAYTRTEENGVPVLIYSSIGQSYSQDSKIRVFNYGSNSGMVKAVRIYYFRHNGREHVSQLMFKHDKYSEFAPPLYSSDEHRELQLAPTEYITEIHGERTSLHISWIQVKTNERNSISAGVKAGRNPFTCGGYDKQLLYAKVNMGMWIYRLQFIFLAIDDNLKSKTLKVTKRIFNALQRNVTELPEILSDNTWMWPDIAAKACSQWTVRQNSSGKVGCKLQTMLNQLKTLHVSIDAFMTHKPRQIKAYSNYDTNELLLSAERAKNFHDAMTNIQLTVQQTGSIIANFSKSLGNYFKQTAQFDKDMAKNDAAFIQSKLTTLKKKAAETSNNVSETLKGILRHAKFSNAADYFQKGLVIVTEIAAQSNPFKWMFATDPNTLVDRVNKMARVLQNLRKTLRLLSSLKNYVTNMDDVMKKLNANSNSEPRKAMAKIVNTFDTASRQEQDKLVEEFVQNYGHYSPAIGLEDLSRIAELLRTVASASCDLLNAGDSAASIAIQGIGDTSRCTRIYADIEQLATINEEVYNFQNELLVSFTQLVRASIAKNLADDILNVENTIDLTTATIGSMMVEIAYQAKAHARCMVLEYTHGGKRPDQCENIIFTSSQIHHIIGFTGSKLTPSDSTRYAYIPTQRPNSTMNGPWVDLDSFIAGNEHTVELTGDINLSWLTQYGWLQEHLLREYPEASYYIRAFEAYVPGIECESGEQVDITVDAESSEECRLFHSLVPPSYNVHPILYSFTYNKHKIYHNRCPTGRDFVEAFEVKNNLTSAATYQQVCIVSEGRNAREDIEILPSLFSFWKLRLLKPSTCKLVRTDPNVTPMITVKLDIRQIRAQDINECWPYRSRCPVGQNCLDRILDFECQNNSK